MHSKDRWGDDADIFRPERFSETDEDTRVNRERLTDLAFGYGRFGCAGKPLAFLELHKVFFEVRAQLLFGSTSSYKRLLTTTSSFDTSISSWSIPLSLGSLNFGLFGWRMSSTSAYQKRTSNRPRST